MPPTQRGIFRAGLRSARWTVALFVLVTLAAAGAAVGAPLILAAAVDSRQASSGTVLGSFALFALALGCARSLQDVRIVLMNQVQQRVATVSNTVVMRALVAADPSLVDTCNPARISAVVSGFNGSTKMWVQMFLMALLGGLADVVISFLVIGGYVDWTVGAVVLACGAVTVWSSLRANDVTSRYLKAATRESNQTANLLGNVISNLLPLRIFGGLEWVLRLNERHFADSRAGWLAFYRRRLGFGVMQGALLVCQYLVVVGLALRDGASVGTLIVLVMVLAQVNRPFELIATSLRDFTVAESQSASLRDLLEEHRAPAVPGSDRITDTRAVDIVLRDLGAGYGGRDDSVIEGVCAELGPGRLNFLTGASGAGKSTLTRAMLGLHPGYRGTITLGGVDLTDLDIAAYWRLVGYVSQESMMMNLSIRENVCFGREFTDDRIVAVLGRVAFGAKLAELPEGLDFVIGERGARLSGGERQRLALARALIGEPRLLLLDEATSALDHATEQTIYARLRELCEETTVVAVTHRRALIGETDTVVDLDDSRTRALAVP